MNDQLLVYLVHPANLNQTLLDRGQPGTNIFSLLAGQADFQPGLVRFDGRTVEIDTTSLGNIGQAALKFQLIDTDTESATDLGSRVVARASRPKSILKA